MYNILMTKGIIKVKSVFLVFSIFGSPTIFVIWQIFMIKELKFDKIVLLKKYKINIVKNLFFGGFSNQCVVYDAQKIFSTK